MAATSKSGKKRIVLVRSTTGIFMGELSKWGNAEAVLLNARRLWYWSGAASLSELATEGTGKPSACKFPCAVERVTIPNVMEMIDVTARAKASIDAVPNWSARSAQ